MMFDASRRVVVKAIAALVAAPVAAVSGVLFPKKEVGVYEAWLAMSPGDSLRAAARHNDHLKMYLYDFLHWRKEAGQRTDVDYLCIRAGEGGASGQGVVHWRCTDPEDPKPYMCTMLGKESPEDLRRNRATYNRVYGDAWTRVV